MVVVAAAAAVELGSQSPGAANHRRSCPVAGRQSAAAATEVGRTGVLRADLTRRPRGRRTNLKTFLRRQSF